MDRTRDFLKLANSAALSATATGTRLTNNNATTSPSASLLLSTTSSSQPPPPPRMTASVKAVQFNQRASEISKGIQACSLLLARLTSLTRVQSMFSDGDDETMRLTITVKNEVAQLKKKLADLDEWLKHTDLGTGKDAKKHSELVVKNMEMSLHSNGVELVRVLEGRKSAMEAQHQRKRMFGGDDDDIDMGKPMSFAPQQQSSNQHQQQQPNVDGGGLVGGQMTLIPDHKYLRSRVDGVNALQSHIAELGQVMTTLATMVHEQDHLVDELANNVDDASINLNAGYGELVRYYNQIKGNRQLVQRLFFVMVAFMVFFMLFLA